MGDLATLQRGFDLPVQSRLDGEVPVVASNGPVGNHAIARVKGPGVVTGRSGTIGRVFYYATEFWPLNTTLYVKDFHGNHPRYVAYVLESLRLENFVAATGVPTLNRNVVHPLTVAIPPLSEQRKIAAILSSVDDTIEKTDAVIDQLQVVKKALMQELLTRGMPGRHTRFKQTEIGEVPEEWEVSRLLDLVALPSGQVNPRVAPYRSWPLVAPNHIERETGRLLTAQTAELQAAISGKYAFRKGDVLYSKIRPYLRKATLAEWDGLCSADMYPLRPSDRLSAEYLLAVVLSDHFTEFAVAVSMRTGIPKINREELGTYRFALPTREEQDQIAASLRTIRTRIDAENDYAIASRSVKAALMNVLLTGRVRVAPDEAAA